jgi:hypothetical protein
MLRLLKLLKLDEYIAALETELKINLKVLKIVKMVLSLLFLMHLLGCFWFYIALTGGYEVTWISEYDHGSGLDKPVNVQYLYSVYWALMTLTTVGYGGKQEPLASLDLPWTVSPLEYLPWTIYISLGLVRHPFGLSWAPDTSLPSRSSPHRDSHRSSIASPKDWSRPS